MDKKTILVSIIILSALVLGGCTMVSMIDVSETQNAAAEYKRISPEDAKKMLDENSDAVLLDVRTESEYNEQRIDGALLLPNNEIEDRAAELLPDKDALILVYCRSGRRSKQAALELLSMGYTNVYDFGGIMSWPYDVVSE